MLDDELESGDFEETDDEDNYLVDLTGDDINDEDEDSENDEDDEEEEMVEIVEDEPAPEPINWI